MLVLVLVLVLVLEPPMLCTASANGLYASR